MELMRTASTLPRLVSGRLDRGALADVFARAAWADVRGVGCRAGDRGVTVLNVLVESLQLY